MACPRVDWIVGTSIIVYFATAITELVSSVPMGLVLSDFKGSCVLSAKVTYRNDYYKGIQVDAFGSVHSCEFCAYLTIISILYPLVYGTYSLYAIWKSVDNASLMWVLPALMINVLLLVLKFISSCILSAGVSQLCSSVSKSAEVIESCQEGQKYEWFTLKTSSTMEQEKTSYNGKNYYTYLATAQSASWFCVFEWLILSGLTFLHYRRNISLRSRQEKSDQTAISTVPPLPGNSFVNPNFKES